MGRYAVVGASQGTGLLIANMLAAGGSSVRAISRRPPPAQINVEPVSADVTDPASIARALDDVFDAVFFTVDKTGGIGGHALLGNRAAIRAVSFQGCVNTMAAIRRDRTATRMVLLSVMGVDQSSPILSMLNTLKPGLRDNVLGREQALRRTDLPFVIIRAPKLTNGPAGELPIAVTEPTHKLGGKMSISRVDLAEIMIRAAERAPARSTWDVFPDAHASVAEWASTSGASSTAAR